MQKYIRPNQKALIEPDATHDLPIHGHCIVHTKSDVIICMNSWDTSSRLSA